MKGIAGLWMPFMKVGMFLQNLLPHLLELSAGMHFNCKNLTGTMKNDSAKFFVQLFEDINRSDRSSFY